MQNTGWRTIIIDKHCELSLEDGCIKVVTDLDISFYALSQIRNLLLLSQQARISTALINELVRNVISVSIEVSKIEALVPEKCDVKMIPLTYASMDKIMNISGSPWPFEEHGKEVLILSDDL